MTVLRRLCMDQLGLSDEDLAPYSDLSEAALFTVLKDGFAIPESELFSVLEHAGLGQVSAGSGILVDEQFFSGFDANEMAATHVVPLFEDVTGIGFAVSNPFQPLASDRNASLFFLSETEIRDFYRHRLGDGLGQDHNAAVAALERLCHHCISIGGSDIHLHRAELGFELSIRVNGELMAGDLGLNAQYSDDFISVLKLRAGMDISLFNYPQDGRLSMDYDGTVHSFRVSTLPSAHGEDVVLRLLNTVVASDFESLGFSKRMCLEIESVLHDHNGLFLVTGPTGSGKTSTLYQIAEYLKEKGRQVLSLEDPIERVLDGIRQSEVQPGTRYGFAEGLRAVLRQDPDVILVGEIRDSETAKIALEAAYTGHLVISSLHTADVQSSLLRLQHFGLDDFLLQHCLKGVLSQRLLRRRCQVCKGKTGGCANCGFLAYEGRQVLAELLRVRSRDYRAALFQDFEAWAEMQCFISFAEDAADKKGLLL